MRGYLKHASTINQCVRCWSIRFDNTNECPTCRALLGEHTTGARLLSLCELSTDDSPLDRPVGVLADGIVNRA